MLSRSYAAKQCSKYTIQTKWGAFVAPTVILQIRKITLLEKEDQGLEK